MRIFWIAESITQTMHEIDVDAGTKADINIDREDGDEFTRRYEMLCKTTN